MSVTSSIPKGIFPSSGWGNWDIHPPTFVCWGWEVGELTPSRLPGAQARAAWGSPVLPGGTVAESPCQCRRRKRRRCSVWVGRCPGGGAGNPLHCSCLGSSENREAWWAAVHRVAESQRRLSTRKTIIWDKETQIPVIERTESAEWSFTPVKLEWDEKYCCRSTL